MASVSVREGRGSFSSGGQGLLKALNGPWHRPALWIFLGITLAHWVEHLLQAVQIYVLGWPRTQSFGALGWMWPWLFTSEWLHYGYALIMLVGLAVLRPAFTGRALLWWTIALVIQFWHHFEHLLLLGQALAHSNLFGRPAPTSILQLFAPRVELHLFYNAVVFVPMLVALYYHMYPPAGERQQSTCTCSRVSKPVSLPSAG